MQTAQVIIERLNDLIIRPLVLLVFAGGFFFFMWGLVMFLWNSKEGEIATEGKQHMLWGIVGMFVMVSVAGILTLITGTFGINERNATDTSNAGSYSNIQFR